MFEVAHFRNIMARMGTPPFVQKQRNQRVLRIRLPYGAILSVASEYLAKVYLIFDLQWVHQLALVVRAWVVPARRTSAGASGRAVRARGNRATTAAPEVRRNMTTPRHGTYTKRIK